MADDLQVGDQVRFAPNPRWPERKVEAVVVRRRLDPRCTSNVHKPGSGWFDTVDAKGVERSVRAGRAEVLRGARDLAAKAD